MKQEIKQWLFFSRKERIGFIALVVVVVLIFMIPVFLITTEPDIDKPAVEKTIGSNGIEEKREVNDNHKSFTSFEESKIPASLFYFDPNNTSAEDWKKLGLRDKTIRTIQNYLSKGGQFRKSTDLQKIYGLRKEEYERLLPYIRMEASKERKYEQNNYDNREPEYVKKDYTETNYPASNPSPNYKKKTIIIDINTADTAQWMELPGIGSKRAWSIVNFRNKLGGFYSIEQVGETYNVPDSIFQQIKSMLQLNAGAIRKININTITKDELKMHPYFKWNLANAIVEYRNQHGAFSQVSDLRKIVLITEDVYSKIVPYLST